MIETKMKISSVVLIVSVVIFVLYWLSVVITGNLVYYYSNFGFVVDVAIFLGLISAYIHVKETDKKKFTMEKSLAVFILAIAVFVLYWLPSAQQHADRLEPIYYLFVPYVPFFLGIIAIYLGLGEIHKEKPIV